jgi:hypothetical protein
LCFALPAFDEDANAAVIEGLVQFVAQAAVLHESLGDELFLGSPKGRLLAVFGGSHGNDGERRI